MSVSSPDLTTCPYCYGVYAHNANTQSYNYSDEDFTRDMSEDLVKAKIRAHYGRVADIRLFQNPCGNGWLGKVVRKTAQVTSLKNVRRVKFGLIVGSSDLIGWIKIDGRAIFLALEVKNYGGKPTEAQINFIEVVRKYGGIAGVVRNISDVEYLIECYRTGAPWPEIK